MQTTTATPTYRSIFLVEAKRALIGRLAAMARIAASLSLAVLVTSVSAVTFTVNSTLDQVDILSVLGTCQTAAGTCTLRAAVMQANRAAAATILLPAGIYTLTIPPGVDNGETSGDLNLTTPAFGNPLITISGAGADVTIMDAGQLDRAFRVHPGRSVAISGVTVRNGSAAGGSSWGGGILNSGVLTVSDSVIAGNHANALGGGISNDVGGTLTVSGSTIRDNFAASAGGGIDNWATLTIADSTIRDNATTTDGSASFFDDGVGGGLSNSGNVLMTRSTLSGNRANFGGGIHQVDDSITIIDSTISGNSAMTDGGGFFVFMGHISVYSSTIVYNDADSDRDPNGGRGGGVFNFDGTILNLPPALFDVRNTLMAFNTLQYAPIYNDCVGVITTYGRNLFWNVNDCVINTVGTWGWVNTGGLGPLQNNGGPTASHALLPGTNAIDGGDPVVGCIDYNSLPITSDQRGFARTVGTRCDIGAFEYSPATLDVDGSITASKYDALTDGLLAIRYMFGLTGPSLTAGAIGAAAIRGDAAAVKAYLDSNRAAFDIDGDGNVDALTDGLLVIRYLFGLRGASLTTGAVATGATRKTATDVESYLATLTP